MSGTGKSSALGELRRLGFQTVDTDELGWTEWCDRDGGYVWREDRISELLAGDAGASLYVTGTVSNQGKFYSRFDAVVLLSAPADVLLSRLEQRTTNSYGKSADERERVLADLRDPVDRELVLVDFKPVKDSKIGELTANFDIVLGATPADRAEGGRR